MSPRRANFGPGLHTSRFIVKLKRFISESSRALLAAHTLRVSFAMISTGSVDNFFELRRRGVIVEESFDILDVFRKLVFY